jgi:hypothetical protein
MLLARLFNEMRSKHSLRILAQDAHLITNRSLEAVTEDLQKGSTQTKAPHGNMEYNILEDC